jgi:hypothetical protein
VVGLALDAGIQARSGRILVTRELGAEYGFTDIGGHQPSREKGVWKPRE